MDVRGVLGPRAVSKLVIASTAAAPAPAAEPGHAALLPSAAADAPAAMDEDEPGCGEPVGAGELLSVDSGDWAEEDEEEVAEEAAPGASQCSGEDGDVELESEEAAEASPADEPRACRDAGETPGDETDAAPRREAAGAAAAAGTEAGEAGSLAFHGASDGDDEFAALMHDAMAPYEYDSELGSEDEEGSYESDGEGAGEASAGSGQEDEEGGEEPAAAGGALVVAVTVTASAGSADAAVAPAACAAAEVTSAPAPAEPLPCGMVRWAELQPGAAGRKRCREEAHDQAARVRARGGGGRVRV
jgi:hypothetical protein